MAFDEAIAGCHLGLSFLVGIGGVEVGEAATKEEVDHPAGLVVVDLPVLMGQPHEAEAKFLVLHIANSFLWFIPSPDEIGAGPFDVWQRFLFVFDGLHEEVHVAGQVPHGGETL